MCVLGVQKNISGEKKHSDVEFAISKRHIQIYLTGYLSCIIHIKPTCGDQKKCLKDALKGVLHPRPVFGLF